MMFTNEGDSINIFREGFKRKRSSRIKDEIVEKFGEGLRKFTGDTMRGVVANKRKMNETRWRIRH